MRILVTGATGFIGKSLIPHLIEDHYVFGISKDTNKKPLKCYKHIYCDLANYYEVENLFKMIPEPHIIIHLASHATTLLNKDDPSQVIDNNIKATYNLCEHCPPRCKFIYASSATVYGQFHDRRDESCPIMPISIYAMSKLASEHILDIYCYDMNKLSRPVHMRMCAVIGPEKDLTHGAVYDFCKKLRSDNETLQLLGEEPGSIKPFVHIDDVIQFIQLSVNNEMIFGKFNICTEDEIDIKTTADAVMAGLKIKKPLEWMGAKSLWKGDNPIIQCSNFRAKSKGWKPKHEFSAKLIKETLSEN